jgi:hypothetical protein
MQERPHLPRRIPGGLTSQIARTFLVVRGTAAFRIELERRKPALYQPSPQGLVGAFNPPIHIRVVPVLSSLLDGPRLQPWHCRPVEKRALAHGICSVGASHSP